MVFLSGKYYILHESGKVMYFYVIYNIHEQPFDLMELFILLEYFDQINVKHFYE